MELVETQLFISAIFNFKQKEMDKYYHHNNHLHNNSLHNNSLHLQGHLFMEIHVLTKETVEDAPVAVGHGLQMIHNSGPHPKQNADANLLF